MPCHAVQSSLSPGILLWLLMQSHGWTTCGSKKHLQISNFQNFTFYSNIQNANAYIRTPSWIYDWRTSWESIALEQSGLNSQVPLKKHWFWANLSILENHAFNSVGISPTVSTAACYTSISNLNLSKQIQQHSSNIIYLFFFKLSWVF